MVRGVSAPRWTQVAGRAGLAIGVVGQCLGWTLLQGGTFDTLDPPIRNHRLGVLFGVVALAGAAAAAVGFAAWRRTEEGFYAPPLRRAGPLVAALSSLLAGALAVLFVRA